MLVFFASSCVAACAESTGPPQAPPQVHPAKWAAPPGALQSFVVYQPEGPGALLSSPGEGAEGTGVVTFWAHQDRDTWVVVRHQASEGTWRPFAELSIPRGALFSRPDGSLITAGDSILITMTVDTTELRVELEPTGLAFRALAPARLSLWYSGANSDFDGNGVVNAVDGYIERTLLGLWLRPTPADPWEPILATHSLTDQSFTATLQHFSGYAVAW